jgi:RNA polymerase sigma-70 factor (ECF subfamily)
LAPTFAVTSETENASDRDLMTRFAKHRDRQAFEILARRWDARVVAFLAKACGDLDSAEDLRQEVFLRVYRYADRYDPRYAFSTWLFRIACNVRKTWARGQGRRIETTGWDDVAEAVARLPDSAPGALERLAQGEARDRLRGEIARLEPDERELLLLRFEREFGFREIAEIQETPETTVKSRFYRILEKLKSRVGRVG